MSVRPSLNALRAFEASVRLSSMSQAASELGVTPGAVSRHVVALEESFGLQLLKRLPQAVSPTPEGARMAARLAEAFKLIDQAIAELEPGPLTLSCSATIMMHWLIPRLRDFKAQHPEVELRLHVDYSDIDLVREEVSVAIRNDMLAPPADVIVKPLMAEEIGVVASPEYFMQKGVPRRLQDLAKDHRILGTKTRPSAWTDWVQATGGDANLAPVAHEVYEHFYLMIQAASFGLGIAVAPRMIVEEEISSGRLAAPLGFYPSRNNIVLWVAPHLRNSHEVKVLLAWLDEQARKMTARDAEPSVRRLQNG
jgi:LysR family glycine cleavage system transcriptional activator